MPLQTYPQYFGPPERPNLAKSIREGQAVRMGRSRNKLAELAVQQAPAQYQRERQTWKREDRQGVQEMMMKYVGAMNLDDPVAFSQQMQTIGPMLARELDEMYGDEALSVIGPLKHMTELGNEYLADVEQGPPRPQVVQEMSRAMNLARVFRDAAIGPQKPMSALDQARTMKTLQEIGEPDKPQSPLGKLIADRDALPEGDPNRKLYDTEIAARAQKEGLTVETDADGNVRIVQGPVGGDMTKKTRGTIEGKLFNSGEQLSRLAQIEQGYRRDYQEGWFQVEQGWQGFQERWMKKELSEEEAKVLDAYSAHKRRTVNNLSLFVNELSGAAVSVQEAKRLSKSLPVEDDAPTVFKAKLRDSIRDQKMAIARYNYYLNKGLSEQNIQAMINKNQAVSLYTLPSIMANREAQLSSQGMNEEQIEAQMKKEFGL